MVQQNYFLIYIQQNFKFLRKKCSIRVVITVMIFIYESIYLWIEQNDTCAFRSSVKLRNKIYFHWQNISRNSVRSKLSSLTKSSVFFFEIRHVLWNTQLIIVSARCMLAGELIDRTKHIRLAHRSIFISNTTPSNQRNSSLYKKKKTQSIFIFPATSNSTLCAAQRRCNRKK